MKNSLVRPGFLFGLTFFWPALNTSCQAAKKGLVDYANNATQDGVYSLFNLIFSRNGVWVLLILAAIVCYLFWRKS